MKKTILILHILFVLSCKKEKTSLTEPSSAQQKKNNKELKIKKKTIKDTLDNIPLIDFIDYDKINKKDIIFPSENDNETVTECVYSRNKNEFLENKYIIMLFDKRIFMNIKNQTHHLDLVTSSKNKTIYTNNDYCVEINLKKTNETFEYAYVEIGEITLKNTKNKILIKEKIMGIDTGY